MACDQCKVPGMACGPISVDTGDFAGDDGRRPCVVCNTPTRGLAPCGAARWYVCGGGRGHAGPTGSAGSATGAADTTPRPVWLRRGAPSKQYGPSVARGPLQPKLADHLTMTGLTPPDVARGVAMWNDCMRGIGYSGGHPTAMGILTGSLRHSAVPELPPRVEGPTALLDAPGADVWTRRSWLVTGALRASDGPRVLAGYDVNAMYLAAAAIDLPHGEPRHVEWPDESVLARPAFVQVSSLEGAPWSIGEHWREGQWMPAPLAAYLRDRGAQFLMPAAIVWDEHRRWLDPHVDLMRAARKRLIEHAGDPAADAVREVVKDIYTRMLGGLLSSREYNRTNTYRPEWRSLIVATAQARMLRNLDALPAAAPVSVVGVWVDAVWFVMPAGYDHPPVLTISTQPGKFKPAGRVPWSPELAASWEAGDRKPLWAALDGRADDETA